MSRSSSKLIIYSCLLLVSFGLGSVQSSEDQQVTANVAKASIVGIGKMMGQKELVKTEQMTAYLLWLQFSDIIKKDSELKFEKIPGLDDAKVLSVHYEIKSGEKILELEMTKQAIWFLQRSKVAGQDKYSLITMMDYSGLRAKRLQQIIRQAAKK